MVAFAVRLHLPRCSRLIKGGIFTISFYSGTPGSGKSYHLARLVYDKLRYTDMNIIANFEINLDMVALTRIGWIKHQLTEYSNGKIKFRKYNKRALKGHFYYWNDAQITVENLLAFAHQNHVRRRKNVDAPQTIVLIDESGLVFNCRGFGDTNRQKWCNFFAKHRHFNFDFILACQFDRQVDKQIRCCVEYEQVHRKLRNYQFLGWLFSVLCGGNLFLVSEKWYANKLHVGNQLIRYSARVAALYDTLRDFGDTLGATADAPPPGVGGVGGCPTAQAPEASPDTAAVVLNYSKPEVTPSDRADRVKKMAVQMAAKCKQNNDRGEQA